MTGASPSEASVGGVVVVADRRGRARRDVIELGLATLGRLAARSSDVPGARRSAGLLAAVPWDLVAHDLPAALRDEDAHRIAGTFALEPAQADRAMVAARSALGRLGWHVVAWRRVPMELDALAPARRDDAPRIIQCFARATGHPHKRTPYRTRTAIESRWQRLGLAGCSVISLSETTIVYKGLVEAGSLPALYPDLADQRFASHFAVLHHGIHGDADACWAAVQPFHAVAHDGVINTLPGNRFWMDVRVADAGIHDATDVATVDGAQSPTLDAAVQWLREAGLPTSRALARLFPTRDAQREWPGPVDAFCRYESCFAEPWEGPATIAFGDGRCAGAIADPHRHRSLFRTEIDDVICLAPDTHGFDPAGRHAAAELAAGEMVVVDFATGVVSRGDEVWQTFAAERDYAASADCMIHRLPRAGAGSLERECAPVRPVSLRALLGRRGQWVPHALPPLLLELESPVLVDQELEALLAQTDVRAAALSTAFDPAPGGESADDDALQDAIASLRANATSLAANGARILVLSDRAVGSAAGAAFIPPILATRAVDGALRAARLRLRASIVVDSGAIHDARGIAMVVGCGASAVVPCGAYATTEGGTPDVERCREVLESCLRSIIVDAGVSSFEAYCGARFATISSRIRPSAPAAMLDVSWSARSAAPARV